MRERCAEKNAFLRAGAIFCHWSQSSIRKLSFIFHFTSLFLQLPIIFFQSTPPNCHAVNCIFVDFIIARSTFHAVQPSPIIHIHQAIYLSTRPLVPITLYPQLKYHICVGTLLPIHRQWNFRALARSNEFASNKNYTPFEACTRFTRNYRYVWWRVASILTITIINKRNMNLCLAAA